mgnify:CR=1 FL=1
MAKIGAMLKKELKKTLDREKGKLQDRAESFIGTQVKNLTSKLDGNLSKFESHITKSINKSIGGFLGGIGVVKGPAGEAAASSASSTDSGSDNLLFPKGKEATADGKKFLCKYRVKHFIVMAGEETIDIDHSNILSIEYMCDYEFNIMALLKVSLQIDIRKKSWIIKNKENVLVKFELDKIGMDVDSEGFNTEPETVWNEDFSIYLGDELNNIDSESTENRINLNEGKDYQDQNISEENYFESQNTMDIYLVLPELIQASRYSFNRIYSKGTLQNIVAHMLTESGHKHVLMSKFENDEEYTEMLLPANPVYKDLIYLDQYYGFYKKGALIFYDIDMLYILNLNGKVTAALDGEWTETTFLVGKSEKSVPGNGHIQREGEGIYYPTVSETDMNSQNFAVGKNSELGSAAKIVVTDTTDVELHEADTAYIEQRNENVSYIKDKNKFTGDVIKARMEENDCVLYFSGDNLDISAFRPNKIFKTIFDETSKQQKYGNNIYRLAYAYHYIKPESNEYMTSSHRFILKRAKKTNGLFSGTSNGDISNLFGLKGIDIDWKDPMSSLGKVFGNIEGTVKNELHQFEDRIKGHVKSAINSAAGRLQGKINERMASFSKKIGEKVGASLAKSKFGKKILGKLGGGKDDEAIKKGRSRLEETIGKSMNKSVMGIVDKYKSNLFGKLKL